MLKHESELKHETVSSRFGGTGELHITHLLEDFSGKGRLFAKNTLGPGASIGLHKHNGDFETYVILNGEGIIDDNGEEKAIQPGDVIVTKNGENHSIKNTGTSNLEFIALILFD